MTLNNDVWVINYNLFYYYHINIFLFNGYDLMIVFIVISSSCKSAQFGFHI